MGVGQDKGACRKNTTLTPKAILHQRYGPKACYRIEEVTLAGEDICPGLFIQQAGRCLFRCHLELPGLSITSDAFTRKKDAEQSAAEIALEKLGIQTTTKSLTSEEAFNELIRRISYLFSNEFLSTLHPLTNHFRVALMRHDHLHGFVPIAVIVSHDLKTINLCKTIDVKVELEPLRILSLIMKAARLTASVSILDGELYMGKKTPYLPDVIQELLDRQPGPTECLQLEAICIPSSTEKPIYALNLNIPSDGYYLDEIASNLNVRNSSRVLLSRNIGKASSEMKLYFPASELICQQLHSSLEMENSAEDINTMGQSLNKRATFISGQTIHGNAIMAVVTYKWNSSMLFHAHTPLCTFYRMILSKVPSGSYKLSRDAVLAAGLPFAFTTRINWRGSLPRDLLCMFCHYHRLLEPIFIEEIVGSKKCQTESLEKHMQMKIIDLTQIGDSKENNEMIQSAKHSFRCGVKIFSRQNNLIIEYTSGSIYSKQFDAVQNAALRVLNWFNDLFKQLDMHRDCVLSLSSSYGINVDYVTLLDEFQHSHDYLKGWRTDATSGDEQNGMVLFNIEGPDSGNSPSQGSLVCISYAITLVNEDDHLNEMLEHNDQFEFEIGTGAVINLLESCVTQMSVNQCANFVSEVPSRDMLLAAAGESLENLSQKYLCNFKVVYSVNLLGVTEPLEDRMEHAFFSPPLSKQRVEFAVKYINESSARTLVDFGCGSGSLLDALLSQMTTLTKVAGVDISRKGLTRAAKILHSKLSMNTGSLKLKSTMSVELYDGSILDFDSRLYRFDIGTCLEVIEHMEEDQATAFGHLVLGAFCPRLLIVSTPNYEYNVILQKSSLSSKEEDVEETSENLACKFRNHDHKFEWTRNQFEQWASAIASRHSYSVTFSGVGGTGDEPGFASQIAVFRQLPSHPSSVNSEEVHSLQPYEIAWRWQNGSSSTF